MSEGLFDRRQGLVKICGLRRPSDAVAAVEAGADLLGFVFAASKRRVTAVEAAACVAAARAAASGPVLAVGVFVDAALDEMAEAVETAGLDLLQLHGDRADDVAARLPCSAIRALRPTPGTTVETLMDAIQDRRNTARPPAAWLIDGFDPKAHGGTGVRANWDLVSRVARIVPTLLAGGLTSENVGEAIRRAGPLGVDVSSGVETDGIKDPEKIAAFVRAARAGFRTGSDDVLSGAGSAASGRRDVGARGWSPRAERTKSLRD